MDSWRCRTKRKQLPWLLLLLLHACTPGLKEKQSHTSTVSPRNKLLGGFNQGLTVCQGKDVSHRPTGSSFMRHPISSRTNTKNWSASVFLLDWFPNWNSYSKSLNKITISLHLKWGLMLLASRLSGSQFRNDCTLQFRVMPYTTLKSDLEQCRFLQCVLACAWMD